LKRQLALALALPKDDASADALRALVRVSSAVRRARTPVANMTLPRATRVTSRKVPVLLAALLARSPMPSFATRMRIITAMLPADALNLEPCPYHTGLQVHLGPAQTGLQRREAAHWHATSPAWVLTVVISATPPLVARAWDESEAGDGSASWGKRRRTDADAWRRSGPAAPTAPIGKKSGRRVGLFSRRAGS
jgi:hypothetical protein